ncbi:DNA repair protein RecO [Candidatus Saccharibacteria bacterium]|nr:DNA repair protein RecO [Candidatus Saccharibacteria bacterium]
MSRYQTTRVIVLSRVDYGEADKIITVLSDDQGKLSLMAKGVRRVKSKLAGGIELFSTSEISYIPGRGSIDTLVSARLVKHYGSIIQDMERTMLGYELIKLLHKVTEDSPEEQYYQLLEQTFFSLDRGIVSVELVRSWFLAQLLRLSGHTPNLMTDTDNVKLDAARTYSFDYDATAFFERSAGDFGKNEIKFLRLLFSDAPLSVVSKIENVDVLCRDCASLVVMLRNIHIRA